MEASAAIERAEGMKPVLKEKTMRKVTKKWTCKDGSKVRICDMSDTHLVNAYKYLDRFIDLNNQHANWVFAMFEDAPEPDDDQCITEIFHNLADEILRRGLSLA